MAHKAKSFKLDEKKKIITIYTNIEQPASEKTLLEFYLDKGYTPKFEEKKPTKTVKEMRKELAADEETLKAFDAAYKKHDSGFFDACKIYTAWKKEHKD